MYRVGDHGHQHHTSTQVSQFWSVKASLYNSQAPRSTVATPLKGHQPCPLCLCINTFGELEHVWIIKVMDNQRCTVILGI